MPEQLTRVADEKDGEKITRPTAFIVDNDPLMMELLGMMLRKRSFEAIVYHDPYKLIDDLSSAAPDVVLSDLDMSLMNGIELTKRIRAAGYTGTVAIVTASREIDKLREVFKAGADEVMFKPVQALEIDILAEKLKWRDSAYSGSIEEIKKFLEPIEQGVVILDEDYRCSMANRAAMEMLRAGSLNEVCEILGSSCSLEALCRQREGSSTFIDLPVLKSGENLLIGIEAHPVSYGSGRGKTMLILNNFSRWKKIDELHTRFATYLSHEMRTPLTAAQNAAGILLDGSVDEREREKFLRILTRSIERLAVSLDEIQRIFMVDGDKLSVCRQLLRLRRELKSILKGCEKEGGISGYKLKAPEITMIAGQKKLSEFIHSAVETISMWLGEKPFIECKVTITDDTYYQSGTERMVKISISAGSRGSKDKVGLKEFLSIEGAHSGTMLAKLAEALDGDVKVSSKDAIKLYIPLNPEFDREKDLVNPLKFMGEKSELENRELIMARVKMIGAGAKAEKFRRILQDNLYSIMPVDSMISKAEEPWDYNIFILGLSEERVRELFGELMRKFQKSCMDSWEEIYPTLKWDISYRREHGERELNELLHLEV